tara:strand:+ start:35 stop:520 length:486 start_codon:yes stop_codon:yes gene_type:complete
LENIKSYKKILGIIILCLLFFNTTIAAEKVNVIDGDTIKLNGIKIRFSGIDAPEKNQTCLKNEIVINCGKLSKEFLIKTIGNNKVTCDLEKKPDKYKRKLGECFINNQSLSRILVTNGYAFDWPYYSNKKYATDQEYAKKHELGLWGMKFEFPWDFKKKNK